MRKTKVIRPPMCEILFMLFHIDISRQIINYLTDNSKYYPKFDEKIYGHVRSSIRFEMFSDRAIRWSNINGPPIFKIVINNVFSNQSIAWNYINEPPVFKIVINK